MFNGKGNPQLLSLGAHGVNPQLLCNNSQTTYRRDNPHYASPVRRADSEKTEYRINYLLI